MVTFKKLGRAGRFANQIGQYAGTRLYAEINGFRHAFPWWRGCEIFNDIPHYTPLEHLKSFILPKRQLSDLSSYTISEKMLWLLSGYRIPHTVCLEDLYKKPEDNISILGYFNSDFAHSLFFKYKHIIVPWFTFKPEIEEAMRQLTAKYHPWVTIHVRRGDFVKLGLAFPVEQQITILKKIRGGRNLFIVSDDKETLAAFQDQNPIILNNPFSHIANNVFAFWLIRNAQAVIGGGSTFPWWASFLGNVKEYYAPPLTHLWKNYSKIEITKQEI